MRTLTLTLASALATAALIGGATRAATPSQAPPRCETLDARRALGSLRTPTGPLQVREAPDRTEVIDAARGHLLFAVTPDGVEVPEPEALRRRLAGQAVTEVVRDAAGRRLYSRSLTPFGARLIIVEPGVLGPDGLQIVVFDNDDVHVTDDRGALRFQRHTDDAGTLTLRDGRCAVRVDAAGGRR